MGRGEWDADETGPRSLSYTSSRLERVSRVDGGVRTEQHRGPAQQVEEERVVGSQVGLSGLSEHHEVGDLLR